MTLASGQKLVTKGESEKVECKTSSSRLKRAAWTVCTFPDNSGGMAATALRSMADVRRTGGTSWPGTGRPT